MTTETKTKKTMPLTRKKAPSRGGARPGSGRPKGSTSKIRIEDLMIGIENAAGMSYGLLLAKNYVDAIRREDWASVRDYDKALMNKMIADKNDITIDDNTDTIEQKQRAFAAALISLSRPSKRLSTENE
jgi:hypothetical protein